jgi:NitT/TauT family transport system ATP-binding protein
MNATAPAIQAVDVTKIFKSTSTSQRDVLALDRFSFTANASEIVAIVGPSGCGKSTMLNIIAGFEPASSGGVRVYDVPVTEPGPDRGILFQTPALFPWFSVFENIVYGPKRRGVPKEVYTKDALALIEAVGLQGFETSYPYQLSGGMGQRAAIARAIICRPKVLLLDEPFGALDAQSRLGMQRLLLEIWGKYQSTILLVTHDVEEAVFLAHRVLVMSKRPGTLRAEVKVEFGIRDMDGLTTPQFAAIRRHILQLIFEQ